ncbi:hypothetical protein OHU34_38300 [Streptomyces sp. NBC_00080]|uniref:hypothetical protein n=1 Tax=Streptomyces sp. NBC_00080 TaxID=2975645 RepID=UPI00324F4B83
MKRRQLLANSSAALSAALVGSGVATAPSVGAVTRSRSAPLPDETVAARIRLFGPEHVDLRSGALPEGRVVFSWLSKSSFAAAVCGRLLYLDTYITRLETQRGRTPLVIADLVDARPDAILLGHDHGDHADNAAYIAARTGATVYASEETCGVMVSDLARMKADPAIQSDRRRRIAPDTVVRTVPVTTAASAPEPRW